jgi:hypothetical protein
MTTVTLYDTLVRTARRTLPLIRLLPALIAATALPGCVAETQYQVLQAETLQLKQRNAMLAQRAAESQRLKNQNAILARRLTAGNAQLQHLRGTIRSAVTQLDRLSPPSDPAPNPSSEGRDRPDGGAQPKLATELNGSAGLP